MSDLEAVSASARIGNVRIVEFEPLIQAFARKIQLCPVKVRQAFRIDENFYAVGLEHDIPGGGFIDIFQFVGHAGTTGCLDTETQADAFAAPLEKTADMVGRFFSQSDSHVISSIESCYTLFLFSCRFW